MPSTLVTCLPLAPRACLHSKALERHASVCTFPNKGTDIVGGNLLSVEGGGGRMGILVACACLLHPLRHMCTHSISVPSNSLSASFHICLVSHAHTHVYTMHFCLFLFLLCLSLPLHLFLFFFHMPLPCIQQRALLIPGGGGRRDISPHSMSDDGIFGRLVKTLWALTNNNTRIFKTLHTALHARALCLLPVHAALRAALSSTSTQVGSSHCAARLPALSHLYACNHALFL